MSWEAVVLAAARWVVGAEELGRLAEALGQVPVAMEEAQARAVVAMAEGAWAVATAEEAEMQKAALQTARECPRSSG